jgi:hypothetical protein
MTKTRNLLTIAVLLFMLLGWASCTKEDNDTDFENNTENSGETKMSSYNSDESHNAGQNCMTCHISGKQGEGWFTTAGTVYNSQNSPYPNATVKLFTGPDGSGSLKASIPVDKKGNFYTTQNIDFGSGLYVVVEGANSKRSMSSSISTGQCNKCHGSSTGKIQLN